MKQLICLLLAAAMVFSLAACQADPLTESTDPAALYHTAAQPIRQAPNRTMEVETTKTVTVGDDTFNQVSTQKVELQGLGTDDVQMHLSEEVELDALKSEYEAFYQDDTLYLTATPLKFQGHVDQEAYLAQFAPGVAVDPALYGSVTLEEAENGYLLSFADPSAPEAWAVPQDARLLEAGGAAQIDSDGNLLLTTYQARYLWGGAQVELCATVKTQPDEALSVPAPDAADYTQVQDVEAIRLAKMALLYLNQNRAVQSVTTDLYTMELADLLLKEVTVVGYQAGEDDLLASVHQAADSRQGNEASVLERLESFAHGTLDTIDNGELVSSQELPAYAFLDYAQGRVLDAFVPLQYVQDVTMEAANGLVWLNFSYTDAWGEAQWRRMNQRIYQDENALEEWVSEIRTTDGTGQWVLDQFTGYPIQVSNVYSSTQEANGILYTASFAQKQSLQLSEPSVYTWLTGETVPEEAPQEPATPLLYRVTGDDGQQMWLLGTIHIGDDRTAYLPQELYEALDGCAALAVECNTASYEAMLEEDPEAAAGVMRQYYILEDGSTVREHLEPEVYEQARALLEATGQYEEILEYVKPYLWYETIESEFLERTYDLMADKGVDNRLMMRAMERGQEIREVESVEFQMEMIANFSQELQAYLLESLLQDNAGAYIADTRMLYEAWCRGDEGELRELVNAAQGSYDGMTDDEIARAQALEQEYVQTVETDRNEGMLTVAQQYLESGEVVFFAVGLAHLLDDTNGLVTALEDLGYTVEQVSYQ